MARPLRIEMAGGRGIKEQQPALRDNTEKVVREGLPETPWERLIGGAILGTEVFPREVSRRLEGNRREQSGMEKLSKAVSWEQIVQAVEEVKGEAWSEFRDRHGDWGRDAALCLGRRAGRLKLGELAERVGGLDYSTAGAAVSRFNRRLSIDQALARTMRKLLKQLSNIEI